MQPIFYLDIQREIESKFNKYVDYKDIVNMWDMAIYYNKLQNSFIKDGEQFEIVKQIQAFDPSEQQVKTFNIKAKNNYTKKQWFYLLLMNDTLYFNVSKMRNELKQIK